MKSADLKNHHIRVPVVSSTLEARAASCFAGRLLFQIENCDTEKERYIDWIHTLPRDQRPLKMANLLLLYGHL